MEKNGKAVIIESPCFFDNIRELTEYLKDMEVEGMLVAYHGAGATFLPNVPKFATQNAVDYSENGGGKALIDSFTSSFGESFDSSVHKITNVVESGKVTIGGMDFIIKQTADAFDVKILKSTWFTPTCWAMTATPSWQVQVMPTHDCRASQLHCKGL